jgi:RimJ/RimL family protein N-acetyltransferase
MTLLPFTPIETPRLILRHFRESDIPTWLAYRADPDVARFQGWNPPTLESITELVQDMSAKAGPAAGTWFQIAVEEKSTNTHIGDIGIFLRGNEPRQAMIGYSFARAAQGKGYATETATATLDYIFGKLDVHRVMADALAVNDRSIRLLQRLGFQQEGYFRESEWFEDGWADDVIYAILRREWLARREATTP